MSTATEEGLGASFWETLSDGLSAFSEGTASFLTRMLGDSNERHIRKLGYFRARRPEDTPIIMPGSLLAPGQRARREHARPSATRS